MTKVTSAMPRLPQVNPATYVRPIHFEDFDGRQFERLVFAFHARTGRWLSLEWMGQQGKDRGRDIVGISESDQRKDGFCLCVICANWQRLTFAKIKEDIDKALASLPRNPDKFRIVCGHDIPAGVRDKAKNYSKTKGVYECELWSGNEFEEFIRKHAESLLQRFVNGAPFPDSPADLLMYAWGAIPVNDNERLALIALAFDRPAFTTPIHQESSLAAFKKAINDTIQVLKTGVWQTRNGEVIRRLPSVADIESDEIKMELRLTENNLVYLRECFDTLVRSGSIKHCGCSDPDCPTYMMDGNSADELTAARARVIDSFLRAYPSFQQSRN